MSYKDFQIIQELGKGAFGTVYKVKRKIDGVIYALKTVPMNRLSNKEKENAINEIRILASISSPNVISYKDAFYEENRNIMCMVMEYADDGDLEDKVNYNVKNKVHFTEKEVWEIFRQIVSGLKALHDKKIMHRDLKCANIFLTKRKEVKIGDMNVSKILKLGYVNTQTGTPYYASPEVWNEKPYDYKSDIWSLGCILFEMCTGKPPFRGATLQQVYQKVTKGIYESIPMFYSKDLKLVISQLLQVNPGNRPTVDSVLIMLDKMKSKNMEEDSNVKYNSEINDVPILSSDDLIKTIKIPYQLKDINNLLPKSKYFQCQEGGKSKRNLSLNKPASAVPHNKVPATQDLNKQNKVIENERSNSQENQKNSNVAYKKKLVPLSREERNNMLRNLKGKQANYHNHNQYVPNEFMDQVVNTEPNERALPRIHSNSNSPQSIKNQIPLYKNGKNRINIQMNPLNNKHIQSNSNNLSFNDSVNSKIDDYNMKMRENELKIQKLKEKYNIKGLNNSNSNPESASNSPEQSYLNSLTNKHNNSNVISTDENSLVSKNNSRINIKSYAVNHSRIKSANVIKHELPIPQPRIKSSKKSPETSNLGTDNNNNKLPLIQVKNLIPKGNLKLFKEKEYQSSKNAVPIIDKHLIELNSKNKQVIIENFQNENGQIFYDKENKIENYYKENPLKPIRFSVLLEGTTEKMQNIYHNIHPAVLQYVSK